MDLFKILALILFLVSGQLYCQIVPKDDYLILISDTVHAKYGYINQESDTVIKFDEYPVCYTDTFKTIAIVLLPKDGFVAIDRNGKVLYEVFPFDNGPDYVSDGLYRIINNTKIGYADIEGNIIIPPKFKCAFPFENGRAKVSRKCKTVKEGEHSRWISEKWYFIDKKGRRTGQNN
jgi:hypothetical protein